MKKVVFYCLMWLSAYTLHAQSAEMSVLKFTALEMYGTTENITARAEFIEEVPGTSVLEYYQWELRPVDGDGNAGDPIFSQGYTGDPNGVDYVFPNDVHSLMIAESDYQISLVAQNNLGDWYSASPIKFSYTQFVLTAPKMICCGEELIVNSAFTGPVMINMPFTHSWSVTPCDAQGNSTGAPIYSSFTSSGMPGSFNVSAHVGLVCDQYYRIDLDFLSGMQDMRPVRRSVVVLVTSYILEAATKYCAGEYVHATAKFCQGPNSIIYSLVQWELLNSDAAGTPLSIALAPPVINVSGIYTFAGSNNLPGGYYLIRLTFLSGPFPGTPIPNSQRTQLIYIGQNFQPAISGPSVITTCNTSFVASPNGVGYSYQWSAYNGATQSPLNANGNPTVTVGRGNYNKVKVIITNSDGCVKQAIKSVTNQLTYVPPITLTTTTYQNDPSTYWITITRTPGPSTANVWDYYYVRNVSSNVPSFTNSCWSSYVSLWTSSLVKLYGYDGYNNTGSINNCNATIPNYVNGRFYKNGTNSTTVYELSRYVTADGCTYLAGQYLFDETGITSVLFQARTASEYIPVTTEEETPMYSVFPNPNNGLFTIQFEQATENAQAELYSITGEKVDAFNFSGTSYTYSPATTLAPGMYMLRVLNNGVQTTQRIIIE
jgi:hypothetical protein